MLTIVLSRERSSQLMLKRRTCCTIPSLLVVTLVFAVLSAVVQAEQPQLISRKELKALAAKIETAENWRYNLKIDSEMWVETKFDLSDPCEPWKRSPIYVSCTAWIDGVNPFVADFNDTKVRVDVHKEVLEWQEGAAPFGENSYSVSFDGRSGRIVRHTTGPMGKAFSERKAQIIPTPPRELQVGWWPHFTGAEFSTSFLFKDREDSLSRRCEWASEPNSLAARSFEFTHEMFQGVDCIKIASKGTKRWTESYWLDPARGFALLGHENISLREDGAEQVIFRMKVGRLKEVAPGVWWPMEATLISKPLKSGDPYTQTVYRASNVLANDPNFVEGIFTVPFPDGYFVDDKVNGKKYRAGQEQKAVEK